jgi:hypothetical protein
MKVGNRDSCHPLFKALNILFTICILNIYFCSQEYGQVCNKLRYPQHSR